MVADFSEHYSLQTFRRYLVPCRFGEPMRETDVSFSEVWEMVGLKDYFDLEETGGLNRRTRHNTDCRVVDMDAHPSPSEISVLHIQNRNHVRSWDRCILGIILVYDVGWVLIGNHLTVFPRTCDILFHGSVSPVTDPRTVSLTILLGSFIQ